MLSPKAIRNNRRGVTILEVLFAIFVVIVGLLGIASIIPLATRNATESNAHNNAQALGQRWFQGFFSRALNKHNSFTADGVGYNWQWYKDYTAGGVGPGFVNFEKNYQSTYPTSPNAIGLTAGWNQSPTYSSVTAGSISRVWGHQAVCIDPSFFTEPDIRQRTGAGTARQAGYRLAVFPYYEDGFNPVTDPAAPAAAWQDQPRMLRATLGFDASSQVARKLIDDIFASPDDLAMTTYAQDPVTGERIKDDTFPATRLFQASGSSILKSATSSEYSWLATVSPAEPRPAQVSTVASATATALGTSQDYLISLVVMHRRDKAFIAPGATLIAGEPEDKPNGERLLWVYPLSGNFSGGSGGRVRLIANTAVDDKLHIGDWIMLGKHYLIDPTDVSRRYDYFRWYRIIAVDQESHVGELSTISPTGTDPYGNASTATVWARDVVLEGPNFNMSGVTSGVVTPTTGTLLNGVITVVERSITVK